MCWTKLADRAPLSDHVHKTNIINYSYWEKEKIFPFHRVWYCTNSEQTPCYLYCLLILLFLCVFCYVVVFSLLPKQSKKSHMYDLPFSIFHYSWWSHFFSCSNWTCWLFVSIHINMPTNSSELLIDLFLA